MKHARIILATALSVAWSRPSAQQVPVFRAGIELVNVGVEQMDAFMKEKTALYMESARLLGLVK